MTTYLRHLGLSFLILPLVTGCGPNPPAPYTLSDSAYGQPLRLTLQGVAPKQAKAAATTALADLHFIEEVTHPWRPGPLGRTNQLLTMGGVFSANPSLLPLLRHASRLAITSQGHFNPALGKLRELWGLQRDTPNSSATPSTQDIEALLSQHPRMQDIHIDGIRMSGSNPALRIDFGPFAQGYALDTAVARLREAGVPRARVDNGDITVVLGADDKKEAVRQQLWQNREVMVTLHGDEALVRLDSQQRTFINPHSGRPLRGYVMAMVITAHAADAAAVAQALLHVSAGKEGELLQRMAIKYALVQRDGENLILTPAMAERLQGTGKLPRSLIVINQ